MKKVLVLGTKNYDFDLYDEFKKKNFLTYFCGNIRSSRIPKHIWIQLDYTDTSALLNFIIENKDFEFIVPGSNDLAYLSSSRLIKKIENRFSKIINIDNINKAEGYLLKTKFRKQRLPFYINSPKILDEEKIDKVRYKFVLKRDKLSGGKGIYFFDNGAVYKEKQTKNNYPKPYVLEEFIEGSGHGASLFVENGKLKYEFFDNEFYCKDRLAVVATSSPTSLNNEQKEKLRSFCFHYIRENNLVDGLFHIQCIKRNKDIFITECTRRLPGDFYHKFSSLSTGHSYLKYYVNGFLNFYKNLQIVNENKKNIVRVVCDDLIAKRIYSDKYVQKTILECLIDRDKLDGYRVSTNGKRYKKKEALFLEFQDISESNNFCYKLLKDL